MIAARLGKLVNFEREFVIDGDGDPLHLNLNAKLSASRAPSLPRRSRHTLQMSCGR
jgi:hypothetical protein